MKFLMFILAFTFISSSHAEDIDLVNYDKESAEYHMASAEKYFELAALSADARLDKNLMCVEGTYLEQIIDATLNALAQSSYASSNGNNDAFDKMYAKVMANKNLAYLTSESFAVKYYVTHQSKYTSSIPKSENEIVARSLVGTTFWSPAQGAYGSGSSVEFINDTVAKVGSMQMPDDGSPYWTYKIVNYSVTTGKDLQGYDATVIVIDNKRFIRHVEYRSIFNGETQLFPEDEQGPGPGGFPVPAYMEFPGECDA